MESSELTIKIIKPTHSEMEMIRNMFDLGTNYSEERNGRLFYLSSMKSNTVHQIGQSFRVIEIFMKDKKSSEFIINQ